MKHNKLQIVTLKNHDPDILDHLFQIMCYKSSTANNGLDLRANESSTSVK